MWFHLILRRGASRPASAPRDGAVGRSCRRRPPASGCRARGGCESLSCPVREPMGTNGTVLTMDFVMKNETCLEAVVFYSCLGIVEPLKNVAQHVQTISGKVARLLNICRSQQGYH